MSEEPVTLVTAGLADLTDLVELDKELFDEEVRYGPETFMAYILMPTADVRLALLPEGLVGLIIVEHEESIDPTLVTVNVAKKYQRHGIGALLLHEAMRLARAAGGVRLHLQVATNDEGAKAFYQRQGFTIVERLTAYYGERGDAWSMVVEL